MRVEAVRNHASTGIERYCRRLADALDPYGIEYELDTAATARHLHFGNSSRSVALRAGVRPYVLTVHDVRPRASALGRAQRAILTALTRRARVVVVHSAFAADLLVRDTRCPATRIEVVPHGAPQRKTGRSAARTALGWGPAEVVALLPGVVKSAKLVRQAVEAARPLVRDGRLTLVLAGRAADEAAVAEAISAGATVLDHPDDRTYDLAMAAADVVVVLRSGSVGESNGPLLEALGHGTPVVATRTGSIAELAGDAAVYVSPTVEEIRAGLTSLLSESERAHHAAAAHRQGAQFAWSTVAATHADLFRSAFA
jgi:glycosyltransferase involved in cell wall biosynthesis